MGGGGGGCGEGRGDIIFEARLHVYLDRFWL